MSGFDISRVMARLSFFRHICASQRVSCVMKRQSLSHPRAALEWPTLILIVVIYGGWLALTFWSSELPWWVVSSLGAILLTWHGSLQHEIIHGHPTQWRRVNMALGFPPLSLWLPFELYRRSHLVHHRDERLTDPLDDPESYYWTDAQWSALHPVTRKIIAAQNMFLGRLILGPPWMISKFIVTEWKAALRNKRHHRSIWLAHLWGVAVILLWLKLICGMSVLYYVVGVVYPGTALLLIRSFAEHRASDGVFERTAIVENASFLGLLFLYNNLHAAHHAEPTLPWYSIPAWYRAHRARLIAENGGLVYNSYLDVARRYFLRHHDKPLHPSNRAPLADGRLP